MLVRPADGDLLGPPRPGGERHLLAAAYALAAEHLAAKQTHHGVRQVTSGGGALAPRAQLDERAVLGGQADELKDARVADQRRRGEGRVESRSGFALAQGVLGRTVLPCGLVLDPACHEAVGDGRVGGPAALWT